MNITKSTAVGKVQDAIIAAGYELSFEDAKAFKADYLAGLITIGENTINWNGYTMTKGAI